MPNEWLQSHSTDSHRNPSAVWIARRADATRRRNRATSARVKSFLLRVGMVLVLIGAGTVSRPFDDRALTTVRLS